MFQWCGADSGHRGAGGCVGVVGYIGTISVSTVVFVRSPFA